MIICRNDNFTEAVKEAEHLNALCESMLTCPIITHLFKHIEDSDTDAYLIPDYVNKPAEEDDDILSLTSKWGPDFICKNYPKFDRSKCDR